MKVETATSLSAVLGLFPQQWDWAVRPIPPRPLRFIQKTMIRPNLFHTQVGRAELPPLADLLPPSTYSELKPPFLHMFRTEGQCYDNAKE